MVFKNRVDAGQQLAALLADYQGKEIVVYGIPRGGVVLAAEIAKTLHASLDILLAHKIGHPNNPEYAIAAVSESGHLIGSPQELMYTSEAWLTEQKELQMKEMQRRRQLYLKGRKEISVKGKTAIIVDDGIATGLTMQAGILELKERQPKEIIAAVPVTPHRTAEILKKMADRLVAVLILGDDQFFGSVGAYYKEFPQVEDREVISLLS